MEELILFKCSYNPKQSTDSVQSYQNHNDIFLQKKNKNSKIYMEPQKTPNSQRNLEKKNKAGGNTLPYIKVFYKAKLIKPVW